MFDTMMFMKFRTLVDSALQMSTAEITERLREIEAAERQLVAEKAALLAVAEAAGVPNEDGHASTFGWLIAETNCSRGDAGRAHKLSRLLNQVERIADAIAAGRVGVSQAHELAKAFSRRTGGSRMVDAAGELIEAAEHRDFNDFRTVVSRWESEVDPASVAAELEQNVAGRRAHVAEVDGAVDIAARGGDPIQSAGLSAIFRRYCDAEFRKDAEQARCEHGPAASASKFPRSAEQRRFDALVAIFHDAVMSPVDGVSPQVVVNVVVSQDRFERGLADVGLFDPHQVAPTLPLREQRCETAPGTVLPTDLVTVAALSQRVRRVILDPNGRVVDYGRTRRLFTKTQREAAALLPTSCSWPGCHIPAEACHTDHLDEWARDDGATDIVNATPDCPRHNSFKSAHGVRSVPTTLGTIVHQRGDGSHMQPVGASPPPIPLEHLPVPSPEFQRFADSLPIIRINVDDLQRPEPERTDIWNRAVAKAYQPVG